MTKTEIAKLAILGLSNLRRAHLDVIAIMQGLHLSTDEAVELRAMLVAERRGAQYGTDRYELLDLGREVANQYARDIRLRSAA